MSVGLVSAAGLQLSKRKFLQGVGGTAVGLLASGAINSVEAAGTAGLIYEIDNRQEFNVIVIGAGSAGLPLAITAAGRGANVLVIEKADRVGGTLYMSGGRIAAAGTRLQKRKGIIDDPQYHYDDIMRHSKNTADPVVTRLFVNNAAEMVDWLEDNGLKFPPFMPETGSSHAGFKIPRYQAAAQGGRSILNALMPAFLKGEASGNIRVLTRTGAVELVQGRNQAITGVIVEDESGARTKYKGKNVVIATGGCMADKAVFEKYHRKPLYGRRVWPYATGEGFKLGLAVGGNISGGEHYLCHRGSVMADRSFPAPQFTSLQLETDERKPWEIEVNKLGNRYVAEDSTVDILERAQTAAPEMASWVLFDQEIYEKAPPLMRITKEQQVAAFESHAMFAMEPSMEAVARRMGLPTEAVLTSVAEYNQAVASGVDKFSRKHMPLPLARAPFYGIEHRGSSVFSTAGLDIDGELRVVDKRGRPIPNLYAAGEVSGCWHTCGNFIVNGGALTPALVFGYLLGSRMLKLQL